MKRRARFSLLAAPLLAALVPAAFGAGPSLQDLVSEGRLELNASVTPGEGIVPGQKLSLSIAIATDRWFSGGTRISLPEVPGLVILQTEQFASNASERRAGRNWVQQRWTLDVYPQRAGQFTVPPITVRLKVNTGEDGDVEGALQSPPVAFAVTLPAALSDVEQWVAAPEFTVTQSFDRSLKDLQPGNAFEREVVFEASDVMAMMLPTFTAEALPGLAAYPAPPVLDNSSNRGQTRASRSQRISYVVQAEGEYQLPALDFFWWNTASDELKVLSLPTTVITVGEGAAGAAELTDDPPATKRQMLLALAGFVALALLLYLAVRYLPRLPLQRLGAALRALTNWLRDLRKPALPDKLNPGSSAVE